MRPRMSASPKPLPRFSLAATCLGHAALFTWAGVAMPWRPGTTFAISLGLLVVLHLATGVVALLKRPHWLQWTWRALAAASALTFVTMGWSMAAAAIYVGKLYQRIGPSVAGGIVVAAIVLGLLTLPISVWGALHCWPTRARSARQVGLGAALLGGLLVLTLPLASSAASAVPVPLVDSQLGSDVANLLEGFSQREGTGPARTVAGVGAATCKAPITAEGLTLLVAYSPHRGEPRSIARTPSAPRLHGRGRSRQGR